MSNKLINKQTIIVQSAEKSKQMSDMSSLSLGWAKIGFSQERLLVALG